VGFGFITREIHILAVPFIVNESGFMGSESSMKGYEFCMKLETCRLVPPFKTLVPSGFSRTTHFQRQQHFFTKRCNIYK